MLTEDNNWFRLVTWTTADNRKLMLQDMDTLHLQNVKKFLESNAKKEIEFNNKSKNKTANEIETLKVYKTQLEKLKGEGAFVVAELIKSKQQKINNKEADQEEQVRKHLSDNSAYKAINLELQFRANQIKERIQTNPEPFMEEKTSAQIINIQENPEDIPIMISLELSNENAKTIKQGDYCHIDLDCFRITSANINSSKDIAIVQVSLNAKSKQLKDIVMENLKLNQIIKIY